MSESIREPILKVTNLTKRFGGLAAVNDVSTVIETGNIVTTTTAIGIDTITDTLTVNEEGIHIIDTSIIETRRSKNMDLEQMTHHLRSSVTAG